MRVLAVLAAFTAVVVIAASVAVSQSPASAQSQDKIAFQSNRDGDWEIYVMNDDGAGLTRLTDNGTSDFLGEWSPDGESIVFESYRDSNNDIYVMDADGSDQTRLTEGNLLTDYYNPTWSPSGDHITYKSVRYNHEIYIMDADGTDQTNLTGNAALDEYPDWSSDGSRIVFISNRDDNKEIYVMDSDGTNQTRLTNSEANEQNPKWSPDGNSIVFTSARDGNLEIYVMDADGSNQTRLTNNNANDSGSRWSPDGSLIAFNSYRDGNLEIYVMDADGSNQTRLTNNEASDGDPRWSPDGSRIAFTSHRDSNWEIYVMDVDGTDQTRLTTSSGVDNNPKWMLQDSSPPTPTPTLTPTYTPTPTYYHPPHPPTIPPVPDSKPDLIVENITVDGDSSPPSTFFIIGASVNIRAEVRNNGDGPAPRSELKYYIYTDDSSPIGSIGDDRVSTLDPGDAGSESIRYTFTDSDGGTRYFWLVADSNDEIDEEDEFNNSGLWGPFEVVTPTPTPTPTPTIIPTPTFTPTPRPSLPEDPTVDLRSRFDVIFLGKEAILDITVHNPLVNDYAMVADLALHLPDGIRGEYVSSIELEPGDRLPIEIRVRADKEGVHEIVLGGFYWPKGNKDARVQIYRVDSFTVPSPTPTPTPTDTPTPTPTPTDTPTPTYTPTPTHTPTYTPTYTPTPTHTPTFTPTPMHPHTINCPPGRTIRHGGHLPHLTHTPTPTCTPTPTPKPTFIVGPTVNLRPVNDVIDGDQDGIIEAMLRNPQLNDVAMVVDMSVTLPSGIHVTGGDFATDAVAGVASGSFEVPPGDTRPIEIRIRSDKTGQFTISLTGLYWPEGNKDAWKPVSFTHPFTVNGLPTAIPTPIPPPTPTPTWTPTPTPTWTPTPTSTPPVSTPIQSSSNGNGGCGRPESPGGPVDASWPLLGLFGPGLALLAGGRRLRNLFNQRNISRKRRSNQ